jgi:hypothetical protein
VAGPWPPAGRRIWDYVVARVTIDDRGALSLAEGAAVVRCQLQPIDSERAALERELDGVLLADRGEVAGGPDG